MKMKLIIALNLIILIVLSFTSVVFAASNKTSCIIYSPNMNGIATIFSGNMANNASSAYQKRGYSTNIIKNPAPSVLFSNVISQTVQLYFTHGTYRARNGGMIGNELFNFILFDKGSNSTGACLTTSTQGMSDYTIDNKTYTGYCVNNINMSHAKLVTLAVCYSAGNGTTDFNSVGAKMWVNGAGNVLGWYDEIGTSDLIKWLNNYHTSLGNGNSVKTAVNYANTCESYNASSNVQKCHLYVNNNTTLSLEELQSITNTNIFSKPKENKLSFENSKVLTISDAEKVIELNDNTFDTTNYYKEEVEGLYITDSSTKKAENVSTYINYHLKIGDFIANSGYTVELDKFGNVKEIYDNTIKNSYSINTQSQNMNQFKVTENDKQKYLEKAKLEFNNDSIISDSEVNFCYDLKENKKIANVTLTLENSLKQMYSYEM